MEEMSNNTERLSFQQWHEFSPSFIQQLKNEINGLKHKLVQNEHSGKVVHTEVIDRREENKNSINDDNILFDEIQYECFKMKIKSPSDWTKKSQAVTKPQSKPPLHMISPLKWGEDSFEFNNADLAEEFNEVWRMSKVHIQKVPKTKNSVSSKNSYKTMSK